MKKADIGTATSQHDSVAIFEHQRGNTYGDVTYVRLMTEADRKTHGEPSRDYNASKYAASNTRISVVFVEPVNEKGERLSRYRDDDFVCADFVDTEAVTYSGQSSGRPLMFTLPIQRLKRQVNDTQTFADFFNEHLAARKQAVTKREQEAKEKARRERAHANRLQTMSTRLFALGHAEYRVQNAGWNSIGDKVEINIDTLSALIEAAEKAGA
jgi:hypothetical protein